jgi:hypothetical protein
MFTNPIRAARAAIPNAFQAGSLAVAAIAAYDIARPLGHLAVALTLGLVGRTLEGKS